MKKTRALLYVLIIISAFAFTACGGGGGDGDGVSIPAPSTVTAQSSADIINCPDGGVRLDYGIDDNKNGLLDSGEVDGSEYICNGAPGVSGSNGTNGSDGLNAIVNTTVLGIGDGNCPDGGLRIESGLDDNADSILEATEVDATDYACNGADGAAGSNGSPGSNGSNGYSAIVNTTALSVGNGTCPGGGLKVESGLDSDNNDILDDPEVSSTSYICNGLDGANGAPGADGSDGLTALINTTTLNVGDSTCLNGGFKVDIGLDDSRDGTLQMIEIDTTKYACNGADGSAGLDGAPGADGTPGTNGSNGLTALINSVTLGIGDSFCPNGGARLDYGVDDNSNSVLDDTEVDGSEYICNVSASANTAPVADAGADQRISGGSQVTLDGSGSSDDDAGDTLIYSWSFVMMPSRSAAVLNDTSAESPTFTADLSGTYILSLSVSDGKVFSAPDYVMITSKSWRGPEHIETNSNNAVSPRIAIDANGNVFAVWPQSNGTLYNIYANRYDSVTGLWGTAEIIDDGGYDANYPYVAVDANGNAMAVWSHSNGLTYNIYANRYDSGTGSWGTPEEIDNSATDVFGSRIAFDSNGNAIAVWEQDNGTYWSINANRYDSGTGLWGTPEEIYAGGSGTAFTPRIEFDTNGNAMAVWRQNDGSYDSINANRYDSGTGSWSTAEEIDAGPYHAYDPHLAVDSNGNAIAVWYQDVGGVFRSLANRYDSVTGLWGTAVSIDDGGINGSYATDVAIDANGNAIAVWYQYDGTYYSIYANRYDSGTGLWGTPVLIEDNMYDANAASVVFDTNGNAIAAWEQYDGTYSNIHVNRYNSGTGLWGTSEEIDAGPSHAYNPQLVVDSNGNAIAVWYQNYGTYFSIYANRYE